MNALKMIFNEKALPFFVAAIVFGVGSVSIAQVDIYQSDAYSVEEMCAREAEQNESADYSEAYDSCIENNRDKPMYQSESKNSEEVSQDYAESHTEEEPDWGESHPVYQDASEQEL